MNAFDHYVVDGVVRLASGSVVLLGKGGTRLQNGQVQTYGLITVFGLIILIAIVALRRFW